MSNPANYRTLSGLLSATERVLTMRQAGRSRMDGMSISMWLQNARYSARTKFEAEQQIADLMAKFSVTRTQDLAGGHSLFGMALPTRPYGVGDNVPGVGQVADCTETQVLIAGQWYHRSVFDHERAA